VPDLLASLAASVAARLVARRETVAVSESSTGGLISAALLSLHTTPAGRRALETVWQAERFAPVNETLLRSLKSWADAAARRGA